MLPHHPGGCRNQCTFSRQDLGSVSVFLSSLSRGHEEADHFALGIVKNSDPGAGAVVPVQLRHI